MRGRPSDRFVTTLAAVTALIGAAMTLVGVLRGVYFQDSLLAAVSYVTDERPFNEIVSQWSGADPRSTLVGVHAFGDYLLPHVWALVDDPWRQLEQVNYLPPVILAFKALTLLPYRLGLAVYLGAMLAALLAPMVWATRGRDWATRVLAVVILALLTGPAIASLDRGNTQGFLPIVLFAFAVAVLRERWGWATALIAVAAIVKIYPILLILILLARRQWKWSTIAVLVTGATAVAFLPLAASDPAVALPHLISDVIHQQTRAFVDFMPYNVSLSGGLAHGLVLIGARSLAEWVAAHALLVGAAYLAFTAPLLWFERIALWLRLILVMMLTTGVMATVYPYAMNWALAAAALAVFVSTGSRGQDLVDDLPMGRTAQGVVMVVLAAALAVYPVFIPHSQALGIPAGAVALASAAVLLASPAFLWVGLLTSRVRRSR